MARARKSILIWGAGGHGRVVAEIARASGCHVLGFVDADVGKRDCIIDATGARVVLGEVELRACLRGEAELPRGVQAIVPAVGDNRIRFDQAHRLGALLAPPLIHPSAVISPSATVQPGTVIAPLAVLNAGARVGRGVIVNTLSVVGHDCVIEDGAQIGSGAVLTGGVRVGERAFVAAGSIVLPGVRVGADVLVGAGAVVLSDLTDGVRVAGVPARLMESRQHGNGSKPDLSLAPTPVGA
jgi:sugar O-acyltransferase (sialic acid O-acetyltransferase NeuD family)